MTLRRILTVVLGQNGRIMWCLHLPGNGYNKTAAKQNIVCGKFLHAET